MSVTIIDYGLGNLGSVRRTLEDCGAQAVVSGDPDVIRTADALVLPGVGAFAHGMQNLHDRGLVSVMTEVVQSGRPLLGICLGMQLLADEGTEGGTTKGLGFVSGRVEPMDSDHGKRRIPHVGWNEIHLTRPSDLTRQVAEGSDFYFVHSYHFRATKPDVILATTPYGDDFVSIVQTA